MTPTQVKKLVKRSRKPGESRNAQAKRTGIPFVTLGRMELLGQVPRNPVLREAYIAALKPAEAANA